MLGGKLVQHIGGCLTTGRAVEQGGEFLDPAVLQKPDGLGAGGAVRTRGCDGRAGLVGEPVPAVLEGIGRQVDLLRRARQGSSEVGQMPGNVGPGQGLGDLAVVGDGAAQRRDRLRRGQRVGPGPQGGGGEHRLRAHLEQQGAAQLGQRRHTLGEFDRLARMAAPVGAVEPGAAPEYRPGPVAHQDPLRRGEFETAGIGLEVLECRIQQRRVECVAGVQPVAADTVGGQPVDGALQVGCRPRQHGVGTVVGGDRQARELVGEPLDPARVGEDRRHPAACR